MNDSYPEQEWAYDFRSDLSLDDILERFNEHGPWQWQARENYIEGDYLNCRPQYGLRLKLNAYPQAFIDSEDGPGYRALIRVAPDAELTKDSIDGPFRALLEHIDAHRIVSIEPYD